MKKNISIIANFCRPFDGRVDGRFLYLAEMLSGDGHKVELITSDFMHGRARYKDAPASQMYKSKLTYVHEPAYYHNVSLKRLFSHFVWGRNVSKYLKSLEKPDCVYCAVPSLTAAFLTSKYCKKHKIPFIIGDLKEGIRFFDRKRLTLNTSNVASIGELNAFEEDLTLFRGIEREDCKIRDDQAFVNAYISATPSV